MRLQSLNPKRWLRGSQPVDVLRVGGLLFCAAALVVLSGWAALKSDWFTLVVWSPILAALSIAFLTESTLAALLIASLIGAITGALRSPGFSGNPHGTFAQEIIHTTESVFYDPVRKIGAYCQRPAPEKCSDDTVQEGSTFDSTPSDHLGTLQPAWILLLTLLLGVVFTAIEKAGGLEQIKNCLLRIAETPNQVLRFTWAAGLLLFVDDYLCLLFVGRLLRKVRHTFNLSEEAIVKYSMVLSNSAASIMTFSTWGLYIGSLLGQRFKFSLVSISSIYPMLALICCLPTRSKSDDQGVEKDAGGRIAEPRLFGMMPSFSIRTALWAAVVPISLLLGFLIIASFGSKSERSQYAMRKEYFMLLGIFLASVAAFLSGIFLGRGENETDLSQDEEGKSHLATWPAAFSRTKRVGGPLSVGWRRLAYLLEKLRNGVKKRGEEGILEGGMKELLGGALLLMAIFSFGAVIKPLIKAWFEVGTGNTVLNLVTNKPAALPLGTFMLSTGFAFFVGSAWATYAILFPILLALPAARPDLSSGLLYLSLGALVSGGVLGNQVSMKSDVANMASKEFGLSTIRVMRIAIRSAALPAALTGIAYLVLGICLVIESFRTPIEHAAAMVKTLGTSLPYVVIGGGLLILLYYSWRGRSYLSNART